MHFYHYSNGIFVGSIVHEGNKWLDNVDCRGDENKLANCSHAGWGVGNCFPGENVMIQCNNASEGIFKTIRIIFNS